MYKLVILVEPLENWDHFEERWPEFLHLVETLPGLSREATSRVDVFLYGTKPYVSHARAVFRLPGGGREGAFLPEWTGCWRLASADQ